MSIFIHSVPLCEMLWKLLLAYVYNLTSCFKQIKFITESDFTEHTNIATKLKWKLFTKVIREPSKEAWG
jgi:hypothetical protein